MRNGKVIRIALLLMLVASPCFGWGRDGHRIVAAIAESYLSDAAKVAISDLLGSDKLVDVASWADGGNRRGPRHWINVPRFERQVVLDRDCTEGECVVAAITECINILQDPSTSRSKRVRALKYLVHFVGDVHQPLHVAFRDDSGGNTVDVWLLENTKKTNLHKAWDSGLLDHQTNREWRQFADELQSGLMTDLVDEWRGTLDPIDWANESLLHSRNIYAELPHNRKLGEEYFEHYIGTIEDRLSMAGVRLAALLNNIFSADSPRSVSALGSNSFSSAESLSICSFNVQFLGNSTHRDDAALAALLEDYDIVVIQELVSPPYPGTFPDGSPLKPDSESAEFFDEMKTLGFEFVISQEDTGTGDKIHRNGSATEWWVAFFKSDVVKVASDLPSGFLAQDRSNHNDYERVPYAFAFRSVDETSDFVLVSVHLKPGSSSASKTRRKQELSAIAAWIDAHDEEEQDFIILGDMNIENAKELTDATPVGFLSLNDECRATNTNVNGPKPYDHVMFNPTFTTEIDKQFDFLVIDLIEAMREPWAESSTDLYPGDPYDHNQFRKFYSDHHPVVFRMILPDEDDDPPIP